MSPRHAQAHVHAISALLATGERAQLGAWSRAGDRIVFTTVQIDRNNPDRIARTSIHVMDPAKPASARVLEREADQGLVEPQADRVHDPLHGLGARQGCLGVLGAQQDRDRFERRAVFEGGADPRGDDAAVGF